jgi:hypothetical protein
MQQLLVDDALAFLPDSELATLEIPLTEVT